MMSAPEERIIDQAAGSEPSIRTGAAVGNRLGRLWISRRGWFARGRARPGLDVTPESWEPELRLRLRQAPPNAEALLDLYDRVAPAVYGYARQRTRSRGQAYETALSAFLEAGRHPGVFDDARIAMKVQMLLLVHFRTN